MEQIRVIVMSSESGREEEVIFTEDFDSPVVDFVSSGLTVMADEIIDNNLPIIFPTDRILRKVK